MKSPTVLLFMFHVLWAFEIGKSRISSDRESGFETSRQTKPNVLRRSERHLLSEQLFRRRMETHATMLSRIYYPLVLRYLKSVPTDGKVPPLDPNTVVTFEPGYPCPKMLSKPSNPPLQKIFFGTDVEEGEFPFLVAISFLAAALCTGSIATKNHVLTAAHCTDWQIFAILSIGHPNKDVADRIPNKSVLSMVKHPGYKREGLIYDYSVIKVKTDIPFVPGVVEPICLFLGDVRYWTRKQSEPSSKMMIAGWGITESGRTNIAKKMWVSAKACEWEEEVKRKRTHHCYRKARSCCPSHICIKENRGGICSGDSGGPVIGHESSLGAWVQIAINSFTSGPPGKGNLNCGNGDEMSFSGTFFYFKESGPKSMTGNPWCDFFTKEIPNDVHLVKGFVHPNFFCQNPEKRFDWCEFPAPEVPSPEFET